MLEKSFSQGTIIEVKGLPGKPLVITSIIKPQKNIATPADSTKRKHAKVFKDIVESQVSILNSASVIRLFLICNNVQTRLLIDQPEMVMVVK